MNNPLSKKWDKIEWVLTDVDDTLTWQGKLPKETLIALENLQDNDIRILAVTGACAGWCDHIAQLWPVDAVIGENGAFTIEKQKRGVTLSTSIPLDLMQANQHKLKEQVHNILERYPDMSFTLDQAYRLCEVAIDIGQNREPVQGEVVEAILSEIRQLGVKATASSIHINAWIGEHSKQHSAFTFLRAQGLSEPTILERCCYIGDSLNDEQMFASLPLTVGVSNIKKYWPVLKSKPSIVMEQPGGYGFAEFTRWLLERK